MVTSSENIKVVRYIQNSVGAALLILLILFVIPAYFISKSAISTFEKLSTSYIFLGLFDLVILYILIRLLIQYFAPKKPTLLSEIDLSRYEITFKKPGKSLSLKVSLHLFRDFSFRFITYSRDSVIRFTDICLKIGTQGAFPIERVSGKTKKPSSEYEHIFSDNLQANSQYLLDSNCNNKNITFTQNSSTAKLVWVGERFGIVKRMIFTLIFAAASVIFGIIFWYEFETWLIRVPAFVFLSTVFFACLWACVSPMQRFELVVDKSLNVLKLSQQWLSKKPQLLFQGPLSDISEWIFDFRTSNDDEVYEISLDLDGRKKNFEITTVMGTLQSKINNRIYLPLLPQDELLLLDAYCRLKDFLAVHH